MSAQTQVLPDDLAKGKDIFSTLSELAVKTAAPTVRAKWAIVRITPDLATGEILNVGICVLHRKKVHVRLLPNAAPFEALYGQNGGENFGFLLNLAGQHLQKQSKLDARISPQLSLSPARFAAGDSIEEILERLYGSMVTLDLLCRQKSQPEKQRNISTEVLRNRVKSTLRKADSGLADRIWHDASNPIRIPVSPHQEDKIGLEHTQIWVNPDLSDGHIKFASIVSTDYIHTDFSELHLYQAKQDIELAAQYLNCRNKKAGLFVYRPDSLPKDTRQKIDTFIDHTHFLLTKNLKKGMLTMEVENSTEKLAKTAIEFAIAA